MRPPNLCISHPRLSSMEKSHFKTALGQAIYEYGHESDRNNHRELCGNNPSSATILNTEPALRDRRFHAIHKLWSAISSEEHHILIKEAKSEGEKAQVASVMLEKGERAVELLKGLLESHQKLIIEEAENQEHSPKEMRLVLVGKPWKKREEMMWWMVSLLRIAAEWGIGEIFVTEGLPTEPEKSWDEAM
ncbi:hypothetical protein HBH56_201260 [Parastagonospora nodorum]|uniref:Uncharacterized protein n=1 Tax=Phaeosphaeria nodorum (strain SN15 / ATCC MYA-4574 / FGSC 10173) TaxID=321614 RepID=A0A7U2I667_PHANO|nr:hypothetical protein HBH56_201260 [Parastagonospora nodorum]QRD00843.1 hypothetical protein JI435_438680 [Parastagonospora nodorum SN15]KAH4036814.1 hypothetical protein HBI09_077800 [Parastagonospora nodorum]KAH4068356.1 hypothetical protein HBH50_126170 [Parastagonospora nodorum]KAH4078323.1 hypothetical protein HBH48_231760 [Parastagonospora nodorum]